MPNVKAGAISRWLDAARSFAVSAGKEQTASLQRTRQSKIVQAALLPFAYMFEGALIEHLIREWDDIGHHPRILGASVAAGVILLVIAWRDFVNSRKLEAAQILSPTDLHFQLQRVARQNRRLSRTGESLEGWIRFQNTVEAAVFNYEKAANNVTASVSAKEIDREAAVGMIETGFRDVVNLTVEQLESSRGELLGYRDSEIYFFDIFELHRNKSVLERVARAKSPSANFHNRTWEVTEGDVGDCVFYQKSINVDYSIRKHDKTSPWYAASDEINFQCRISTPIFAADTRRHSAYGALCITSSNPRRLREEHVVLVENLSKPLAVLFERREWALRKIERSSQRARARTTGEYPIEDEVESETAPSRPISLAPQPSADQDPDVLRQTPMQ